MSCGCEQLQSAVSLVSEQSNKVVVWVQNQRSESVLNELYEIRLLDVVREKTKIKCNVDNMGFWIVAPQLSR